MVFSGIVECKGEVVSIKPIRESLLSDGISVVLRPEIQSFMNEDISIGCSISVNGVCLTVTSFTNKVGITKTDACFK